MKRWKALCKSKLCWWLVVNLVLIAVFEIAKTNRTLMNFFTQEISTPVGKAIGSVSYLFPSSVMETLYVTAAGVGMIVLARFVVDLVSKPQRLKRLLCGFLVVCNLGLSIYAGFCGLWGVQYYGDGFSELSGLEPVGGTTEELAYVMYYFVWQLHQTYDQVERDENGLFAVSQEEILADAPYVYDWVESQYPFLEHDDAVPRSMAFSQTMSEMNFTGVYSPFTGEAHLNVASPSCLLPATIAHELGHLRGIAPEDECNFLGVLASVTSGNPVYEYSGYLSGYIYLSNALYSRNYELWYAIASQLPYEVTVDLNDNTDYWSQYKTTPVATVSQGTYDAFLKNYGQTDGIQSYGMVVDLLLAYYLPVIYGESA
ncbi:DUF3810 domain-containing protein [Bengtsoniella intestinalis]|uniref:DUF3810 domain-containing protein n=1 Tax=Bengtsoniella intestinalis TaxID=3073143 RepID=UPI00391F15B6